MKYMRLRNNQNKNTLPKIFMSYVQSGQKLSGLPFGPDASKCSFAEVTSSGGNRLEIPLSVKFVPQIPFEKVVAEWKRRRTSDSW